MLPVKPRRDVLRRDPAPSRLSYRLTRIWLRPGVRSAVNLGVPLVAGLVAATPHLGFVAALGFTDGISLLATTGVLLALARVCGAGRPAGQQQEGEAW